MHFYARCVSGWNGKRERGAFRYELGLLKSSPKVASSIRLGSKVKLGAALLQLSNHSGQTNLFLVVSLKKSNNTLWFFSLLNVVENKISSPDLSEEEVWTTTLLRIVRRSGLFSLGLTMQACKLVSEASEVTEASWVSESSNRSLQNNWGSWFDDTKNLSCVKIEWPWLLFLDW